MKNTKLVSVFLAAAFTPFIPQSCNAQTYGFQPNVTVSNSLVYVTTVDTNGNNLFPMLVSLVAPG